MGINRVIWGYRDIVLRDFSRRMEENMQNKMETGMYWVHRGV